MSPVQRTVEVELGYARLRQLYLLSNLLSADAPQVEVLRCLAASVSLRVAILAEERSGALHLTLSKSAQSSAQDVDRAVEHARNAFTRLSRRTPPQDASLTLDPVDLPRPGKPQASSRASYAVLPIVAEGRDICGLLCVQSAKRLSEAEVAFLSAAADQISLSWDRRAAWQREVRLRERAEALDRTQKELVAVVSHDLRNPIGAVLLGISTLQKWPNLEAAMVRDHLETMQRAAQRASKLVHDLLDVARLDAGHLQLELARVPVPPMLRESAQLMQPLLEERQLVCEVEADDSLPPVVADRERVLQVLSNLLGNARKFAHPKTRIAVTAWAEGGEVRCCVADEGPGIDAEDLPRVFDRYFQGPHGPTAHGAGLGLAIARGIVEAHRGRIWVESRPGHGARFYFSLPVA